MFLVVRLIDLFFPKWKLSATERFLRGFQCGESHLRGGIYGMQAEILWALGFIFEYKIWENMALWVLRCNAFYYIDMSVLPKNRQLVFSIRNYIRDTSEIFSISIADVIPLFFLCFSSIFLIFETLISM